MHNLRRFATLAILLIVIVALATSCKPENWPGSLSSASFQVTPTRRPAFISPLRTPPGRPSVTPHPTPRLSDAIQMGSPTELSPSDMRLKDWQFNMAHIDGDVLFAVTGTDDPPQVVAVNLRSGNIGWLENSFALNSQWPTTQRYFAWTETSNGARTEKLYVYDLTIGKKFAVKGDSDVQRFPDVSGDTVVWSEAHGDHWEIYAYRIASGQLIAAITHPGSQSLPKIDGDWIAYMRDAQGTNPGDIRRDVYLHNLTTGEDLLLGALPYASGGGTYGIAHGRVVWVGWTSDEFKQPGWPPPFHIYDLQNRTDRVLDNWSACAPTGFQLAGDLIQFSCPEGFYGYDLAQDALFSIPLPRGVGEIYLSETKVVFQMEVEKPRTFLTPGAPTATPGPYVPERMKFKLFVLPINRR